MYSIQDYSLNMLMLMSRFTISRCLILLFVSFLSLAQEESGEEEPEFGNIPIIYRTGSTYNITWTPVNDIVCYAPQTT